MRFLLALFLFTTLLGCQSYSEEEISAFDTDIKQYIEKNDLKFNQLESGLYYKVKKESKDAPRIKYTDQVTFYYTGMFLSGEVFQSIPKNDPLTYKVKELIAGWQDGLMQLHGPGTIELIIPPHLGYGAKNTDKIPPNSILHYTLTVVDVK